jgi:hypothetical protein
MILPSPRCPRKSINFFFLKVTEDDVAESYVNAGKFMPN